jgi:transketolase
MKLLFQELNFNKRFLFKAFDEASATVGRPTAILAKTFKGYKFPTISDELDWHGKPLGAKADEVIRAIEQQMQPGTATGAPKILEPLNDAPVVDIDDVRLSTPPAYKMGEMIATRFAYGTALAKLAEHNPRVIALDGDTKNSTYSDRIKKVVNIMSFLKYNYFDLKFMLFIRYQLSVTSSVSSPSRTWWE